MSEQNGNGNGAGKTNAIVSAKDKRANIEKVLLNSKGSWAALLPKHIKQDAMLRSVMAAVAKTPELLECSPASIVSRNSGCDFHPTRPRPFVISRSVAPHSSDHYRTRSHGC